jgi:hypothetical protein
VDGDELGDKKDMEALYWATMIITTPSYEAVNVRHDGQAVPARDPMHCPRKSTQVVKHLTSMENQEAMNMSI